MNIIAYCVFGEAPHYRLALPAIVRAHHHIFPGWQLWLHHDEQDVSGWQGYVREGLLKLVNCAPYVNRGQAMLWRMKPIWDFNAEYVLCRDMDSLPMVRDRQMVEEFLSTICVAHTESDHREHSAPFMGGMCGFHAPRFRTITGLQSWDAFIRAGKNDLSAPTGGADQIHLYEVLWPVLERYTCHHRVRGTTGAPMLSKHVYKSVETKPLPDVLPGIIEHNDELSDFVGNNIFGPETTEPLLAKIKALYAQHGDPALLGKIERAECSPSN